MKESYKRSMSKGIIWRVTSFITLAIISYIYTGDFVEVTLITVFATIVFLIVYFIHERIWQKIERPRNKFSRSVAKMFTYITVTGVIIMSTITYLVTGNVQITTNITLTYVILKHIMYVINELIWDKVKWEGEVACQN